MSQVRPWRAIVWGLSLAALGALLPRMTAAEDMRKPDVGALRPELEAELLIEPGVHSSGRAVNAELVLRSGAGTVLEVTEVNFLLEPDHFVCDGPTAESRPVAAAPDVIGQRVTSAVLASWVPNAAVVLDPGASERRFLSIPSRLTSCTYTWPNAFRVLGMSSGVFNIRAEARTAGEDSGSVIAHASIRFDVPFRVVFLGALAGNALAILLIGLFRISQSLDAKKATRGVILRELLMQGGVRFPIGVIAATIALVLARASLDVPGLVSVEVNDFLGGVVIGLLAQTSSRPLAEWLTGGRFPDGQAATGRA